MHLLYAAQCYVAKFQKYFISFLAISRLLVKIEARNRYALFLIVAQCYVKVSKIFFICRTMLCCQFSKYFILFFGHISAAGENRGSE
ncbi:hypothetical protein PUN28_009746 [Cardiocondyla obscurior]|uniref:Uncharacterized protein n=1 Tax=Cardiocondyla obscurior TaxID=286306 RepID=A0AAW2FR55_9HYME